MDRPDWFRPPSVDITGLESKVNRKKKHKSKKLEKKKKKSGDR